MSRLAVLVSSFAFLVLTASASVAAPVTLTNAQKNAVRKALRADARAYLATQPKRYVRPSVRTIFLRKPAKFGPEGSVGVFASLYARATARAARKSIAVRTVSATPSVDGMLVTPVSPMPSWGVP